jgi:hypothetical protein
LECLLSVDSTPATVNEAIRALIQKISKQTIRSGNDSFPPLDTTHTPIISPNPNGNPNVSPSADPGPDPSTSPNFGSSRNDNLIKDQKNVEHGMVSKEIDKDINSHRINGDTINTDNMFCNMINSERGDMIDIKKNEKIETSDKHMQIDCLLKMFEILLSSNIGAAAVADSKVLILNLNLTLSPKPNHFSWMNKSSLKIQCILYFILSYFLFKYISLQGRLLLHYCCKYLKDSPAMFFVIDKLLKANEGALRVMDSNECYPVMIAG